MLIPGDIAAAEFFPSCRALSCLPACLPHCTCGPTCVITPHVPGNAAHTTATGWQASSSPAVGALCNYVTRPPLSTRDGSFSHADPISRVAEDDDDDYKVYLRGRRWIMRASFGGVGTSIAKRRGKEAFSSRMHVAIDLSKFISDEMLA